MGWRRSENKRDPHRVAVIYLKKKRKEKSKKKLWKRNAWAIVTYRKDAEKLTKASPPHRNLNSQYEFEDTSILRLSTFDYFKYFEIPFRRRRSRVDNCFEQDICTCAANLIPFLTIYRSRTSSKGTKDYPQGIISTELIFLFNQRETKL
ncbi:hypothetical protein K0M31_018805 [Melipona bicolor]|uniref:Uncharacterized protein n=1 Tax=Melipona bicolor TaxID=60889 RepID=A0AA40KS17_9HYME|nr:hypothetical protein K0M31_018805 [Melipona bicolor]